MYVSIQEILLVIYTFFEHYVTESILSVRVEENKQSKQKTFFMAVEQMEIEDCTNEEDTSYSSSYTQSHPAESMEPDSFSDLDQGALNLLDDIEEMMVSTETEAEESHYENHEDLPSFHVSEEDMLSIQDINASEASQWEDDFYINHKTAEQEKSTLNEWTAKVIGKEGPFLHVFHGKRDWVHVGEVTAKKVSINDILLLSVTDREEGYSAEDVITLETTVTDEYIIPDEEEENHYRTALAN
ncbi:hypothetical protein [Halobacillus litoralis]|uniref:Uncharacterized protein n=1 Tax=Halobacillus litoralis TaxID=45668 RepID=A0A410MJG4_9BACI|nr:hypothetical protein [Halobacillus litoralis]QAS54859.1 hypothetical protein HLI_21650 [Halobacillus litoralis]